MKAPLQMKNAKEKNITISILCRKSLHINIIKHGIHKYLNKGQNMLKWHVHTFSHTHSLYFSTQHILNIRFRLEVC